MSDDMTTVVLVPRIVEVNEEQAYRAGYGRAIMTIKLQPTAVLAPSAISDLEEAAIHLHGSGCSMLTNVAVTVMASSEGELAAFVEFAERHEASVKVGFAADEASILADAVEDQADYLAHCERCEGWDPDSGPLPKPPDRRIGRWARIAWERTVSIRTK